MTEFISEIKAAWLGSRRRRFYQSTRGIMTPEDRQVLEQEFCRELTAHDAEVAAKALRDAADDFSKAAAEGLEPVLNRLAAKILRSRAHRLYGPDQNALEVEVSPTLAVEGTPEQEEERNE